MWRSRKKLFKYLVFGLIGFSLVFVYLKIKKSMSTGEVVNPEIEGINIRYLGFDKENRKGLEVKCRESRQQGSDTLQMVDVVATIFAHNEREKDLLVTSKAGTSANGFNKFYLYKNPRIRSEDMQLASRTFLLTDLDILSTKDKVAFHVKSLVGTAAAGMQYYIKHKALKLYKPAGTYDRDGKVYEFKTNKLYLIDKKKLLIMDGNSMLRSTQGLLTGKWIQCQFDPDFKNILMASSSGRSHFFSERVRSDGVSESREVKANIIKNVYDAEGRLERVAMDGAASVILRSGRSKTIAKSAQMEIVLNPETGGIRGLNILKPGNIVSSGKKNVGLAGVAMEAHYNSKGELQSVHAKDDCRFRLDDLTGESGELDYQEANRQISIRGNPARVFSGKNAFNSPRFVVYTDKNLLVSKDNIQSTVLPEKRNVLIAAKSIYVSSQKLEISEKGKRISFTTQVKLLQDDVELRGDSLVFDSEANAISSSGNAVLKFKNKDDPFVVQGGRISFVAEKNSVEIEGSAFLSSGDSSLKAESIVVLFDSGNKIQSIQGKDDVSFTRKDISGQSERLDWEYKKEWVTFRNSAQITRTAGGTTKGKVLTLNLKDNQINVTAEIGRTETVIEK